MGDPVQPQDVADIGATNSPARKVAYWLSRASIAAGAILAVESLGRIKHGASSYTPFLYLAAVIIGAGFYGKSHFSTFVTAAEVRTGEKIYWIFVACLFAFILFSRAIPKR